MIRLRPTRVYTPLIISCLLTLLSGCARSGDPAPGSEDPLIGEIRKLHGPARQEALAFARILSVRPSMAHDYSDASGEYCLNTGAQVMTHFSSQPNESSEDVVYFVDAAPLVARGLRLEEFPAAASELGKMTSNRWYRYEGKGVEPHHGLEKPDSTWLMLAVDIQ